MASAPSDGDILLHQRTARLGEDAHEVVAGQRLGLDAVRKRYCQLGNRVRRASTP